MHLGVSKEDPWAWKTNGEPALRLEQEGVGCVTFYLNIWRSPAAALPINLDPRPMEAIRVGVYKAVGEVSSTSVTVPEERGRESEHTAQQQGRGRYHSLSAQFDPPPTNPTVC